MEESNESAAYRIAVKPMLGFMACMYISFVVLLWNGMADSWNSRIAFVAGCQNDL
jgi:hypothetical protein